MGARPGEKIKSLVFGAAFSILVMSSGAAIGTSGWLAAPAALGVPGAAFGAAGCAALGVLDGVPVEVPPEAGFTAAFAELAPALAGFVAAVFGVTFGDGATD
jgi:hypothetical protein